MLMYICKLCNSPLYITSSGGNFIILQCSSEIAKFWIYNRGTKEQNDAHKHFMSSTCTISVNDWDQTRYIKQIKPLTND